MAVETVRGTRPEVVPGVPSRLPALAAEVFGTFVLVLSGTATLLATAWWIRLICGCGCGST